MAAGIEYGRGGLKVNQKIDEPLDTPNKQPQSQKAAIAVNYLPMLEREAKKRQVAATIAGNKSRHAESPVDKKIYQLAAKTRNPQPIDQAAEQFGTNRQLYIFYTILTKPI